MQDSIIKSYKKIKHKMKNEGDAYIKINYDDEKKIYYITNDKFMAHNTGNGTHYIKSKHIVTLNEKN